MTATRILLVVGMLLSALPLQVAGSSPAGEEHIVEMKFAGNKMVFSPSKLTVHMGDRVTYRMISGAPHTVTFYPDKVPGDDDEAKRLLAERLSYQDNDGYFTEPGQSYTIHFVDVPAGKYRYYCIPHEAMGMKGVIKVKK